MAAITEDYVSFEIAKLLKEKGFNERLLTFYITDETKKESYFELMAFTDDKIDNNHSDYCYLAPTLQMAMKWLREVHNIFITIEIKGDPQKEDFIYYKWSVAKYCNIKIDRIDNNLTRPEDYWIAPYEEEETYERTCEAAIKYCLENLI